ncbi:hypothetical protein [Embleya sp. NBC_00896]|uniref:hypothetical protein n=1 Tax=Embleya sp. NBC_00896 TaxID=2975961 RepID=UPI002F91B840|nr:hypothetical protein OG928_48060 [Embleya sp. NBC_00896]
MSDNASEQPNPEPRPIATHPIALLPDGHVVSVIVPSNPRDCRWAPATTADTAGSTAQPKNHTGT